GALIPGENGPRRHTYREVSRDAAVLSRLSSSPDRFLDYGSVSNVFEEDRWYLRPPSPLGVVEPYGRRSGIFGSGAWESQVSASSASTRRCPSVVPLPSSRNETATSPPRTFVPASVSTTTTWCPSVCPGAGSRRIPGSSSTSPTCSTYVAPSKSTHSGIV